MRRPPAAICSATACCWPTTSRSTTSAGSTGMPSTQRRRSERPDRWLAIEALFGGPATVDNPVDEVGGFTVTSDVLPPEQFPQFASEPSSSTSTRWAPSSAVEGEFAAVGQPRGRELHAPRSDLRPDVDQRPPRHRGSRRSCRATPRRATTTSSSRRTPSGRTTGRRCPISTATRRRTCRRNARLAYSSACTRTSRQYLTPGDPCTPAVSRARGTRSRQRPTAGSRWPSTSRLCRRAGRDRRQLRDGPGHRRHRRRPRRHAADHDRGRGRGRGLRGGTRCLAGRSVRPEGSPTTRSTGSGRGSSVGLTAGIATADTLLLGFGLEQLESDGARARSSLPRWSYLALAVSERHAGTRAHFVPSRLRLQKCQRPFGLGLDLVDRGRVQRAMANGEDRRLLRPRESTTRRRGSHRGGSIRGSVGRRRSACPG